MCFSMGLCSYACGVAEVSRSGFLEKHSVLLCEADAQGVLGRVRCRTEGVRWVYVPAAGEPSCRPHNGL